MEWRLEFLKEAEKDFSSLDHSQRLHVAKAISKVLENPLPTFEGGRGKPLGNKGGNNLSGYYKIKLLKLGLRIVYRLIRENGVMIIIVISVRDDDTVYDIAYKRIEKQ